MPTEHAMNFFEIVMMAAFVAVSAVTVAFSTGVAVALVTTRPKKVAVPAAAPEVAKEPAPARPLMPAAA